ncbi:MAG TPA: leucyl/phenylalanyl-tRNA--protein transferase [Acidimicrobiia bacterium]|nr:leucyl/phenylalanyl-tRNA--protein transferase [Acidimicrobiia bacterium]
MPVEPPPPRYELPPVDPYGLDDLVAVGGELDPGTVLAAYRRGMFPMHLQDGRLAWWSPRRRGILPLEAMKVSRSLAKSYRKFSYTIDAATGRVIEACAAQPRPHGWITEEIRRTYLHLHELGWVHSVETWSEEGELAGGLYGVGVAGLFAGESMFTRFRDASKAALVYLVDTLRNAGAEMLDTQWSTPHLESLGVIEIDREEYLRRLEKALGGTGPWT